MSGTGLHVHPDMTPEEALVHYGKKGMRWGVRNEEESSSGSDTSSEGKKRLSDGQKKALKIAGGALVVGAVITGVILAKNGKIPIGNLRPPQAPSQNGLAKALASKSQAQAARDYATKTRLLDEVAVRNNAAAARQKILNGNLNQELARRAQVNQAATVARGENLAKRLGMTPDQYWQKQVRDFKNQNFQNTDDYR